MARDKTEETISNFVERLGLLAQADGLPRIAGRIMALLIIHGGPFGFSELASRLKVSRASISTNTRLLENIGIIERTTAPGERQDYFSLRRKPYARMLRGYVERMRRARELVESTQAALPEDLPDVHERLSDLDAFYEALIESFLGVADQWEAKSKAPRPRKSRAVRQLA
jgi:DNA-binding transcriptional regulator GbsR (MarR family)